MAVVDLVRPRPIERFIDLGTVASLGDTTANGEISLTQPFVGRREADSVCFLADGRHFVTANEGDTAPADGQLSGGRGFSIFDTAGELLLRFGPRPRAAGRSLRAIPGFALGRPGHRGGGLRRRACSAARQYAFLLGERNSSLFVVRVDDPARARAGADAARPLPARGGGGHPRAQPGRRRGGRAQRRHGDRRLPGGRRLAVPGGLPGRRRAGLPGQRAAGPQRRRPVRRHQRGHLERRPGPGHRRPRRRLRPPADLDLPGGRADRAPAHEAGRRAAAAERRRQRARPATTPRAWRSTPRAATCWPPRGRRPTAAAPPLCTTGMGGSEKQRNRLLFVDARGPASIRPTAAATASSTCPAPPPASPTASTGPS